MFDIPNNFKTTINFYEFCPESHESASSYLEKNTKHYFDWI